MTPRLKFLFQAALGIASIYLSFVLLVILLKAITIMNSDLEVTTHYSDLITLAATKHGIDDVLLAAIVKVESNFDPNAVSYAGAKGLGQLMPVVYDDHCGNVDPFDPRQNLDCSAEYLAWLYEQIGDNEELVTAAYHGGISNVLACMCVPRQIDRVYVERVQAAKTAVSSLAQYPSLPAALYGGAGYARTQGWHNVDTAVAGYDFRHPQGCGGALYAPISGTVVHTGTETVIAGGVAYVNTILVIENGRESVVLYHGDYTAERGQRVAAGATRIGNEATHGWSTGCHSHMSYRIDGIPQTYVN